MQFHHPHGFRNQVCDALLAEMPDVLDALLAAGTEKITIPELGSFLLGLRCRRITFERILRDTAESQGGVTFRTGHIDEVTAERGRVTGLPAAAALVRRRRRPQPAAPLRPDLRGRRRCA
jgi:hypothetical protein